jgi:hypothetical protein
MPRITSSKTKKQSSSKFGNNKKRCVKKLNDKKKVMGKTPEELRLENKELLIEGLKKSRCNYVGTERKCIDAFLSINETINELLERGTGSFDQVEKEFIENLNDDCVS